MALAAVLVALATACGGGSTDATSPSTASGTVAPPAPVTTVAPVLVATESIQRKLVEEQRKRTPNLAVGAAACTDGAPTDTGASVACTVEVEGLAVPFTVTLLGSDAESLGGAESYEFHLARPMVDVTALVSGIRSQAATQLKVAPERLAVDCGPAKVQLVDVGGTVACTVNDGRTTRRLTAVVNDVNGSTTITEA